jgi:hypothetical protein
MRLAILLSFLVLAVAGAQSPPPVIVQAANSTAAVTSTSSKSVASAGDVQSTVDAIKLLEKIKAENDEVLAKQKAALEKLDEIQAAADQLRIFAKRG